MSALLFYQKRFPYITLTNLLIDSSPSYSHLIARLRGADLAEDDYGVYDGTSRGAETVTMRNLIKTLVLFLMLLMLSFSHAAIADDVEDGVASAEKGDFAAALQLLKPLAEQGDAQAQFNLGLMYFNGNGVAQDYKTAVKWYTLAAAQGVASAQYNLGLMFEEGNGVAQDYKTAVKWYTLAAEQGYAHAQNNLGNKLIDGQGVAQDYNAAFKWYTLAAEQGNAFAQYNLGLMYGNAQDYVKAHMWWNIAAIDGNSDALKNYDKAAKLMTPAQIAEAQEAASRCIKQNFKNCD